MKIDEQRLPQDGRFHAEFGKRLFWFENGNDAELDYAYGQTDAVICASYAEGFGLPIAEAARRELASGKGSRRRER